MAEDQPLWLRWLPARLRSFLQTRLDYQVIIENSGWLLFDRSVRLLMGLIVGAWVARHLGPNQYGGLFFAIAIIAFFQPIASLGMDGIVVRDISGHRDQAPSILGSVFRLRMAVSFLSWCAAIISILLLKPGDFTKLVLVSIIGGTLVFQTADIVDLWFQGNSQNRRAVLPKLAGYLVGSGAKLFAIFLDYGVIVIAAMYLLDAAVAAAGLFIAYSQFPAQTAWRWNGSVAKRILRESWPFMLSGLGIIIYIRIDQVFLERFLGSHELGIYAAAIAISTLLPLFPMTLFSSLAPYVARKKLEGEQEYRAALNRIFSGFGLMALAFVIPITLLSGPIISILFGDAYRESAAVLAVHVTSNLFTFQGIAQGLWFINENAGRLYFVKTLVGVLVSIIGNLVLIPRLGVIGAAFVAVAVQFTSSVGINVFISPAIFRAQLRSILPMHLLFPRSTRGQS